LQSYYTELLISLIQFQFSHEKKMLIVLKLIQFLNPNIHLLMTDVHLGVEKEALSCITLKNSNFRWTSFANDSK